MKPAHRNISLVVFASLVLGAWLWRSTTVDELAGAPEVAQQPVSVSSDAIDLANEGRTVRVSGPLSAARVQDPQLGVAAEAVVLLRQVQMFQWQEHCDADACRHDSAWLEAAVDSDAFRQPAGHRNPGAFPFASARFVADEVRLGAFAIDPELAAATLPLLDHPVELGELPPNLEASFQVRDGILYADSGGNEPQVGDLRISYRSAPVGTVDMIGVQNGDHLVAAGHK